MLLETLKETLHTIGSTGSCLIFSEASAIDVSVSAPLAREERGAILRAEFP